MRKKNQRFLLLTAASIAAMLGITLVRAQEPTPRPTPQESCANKTRVYNLEPDVVDAKVKELEAEGYCIDEADFLVVGKQVLLIVGRDDIQGAGTDDECDSGEECE